MKLPSIKHFMNIENLPSPTSARNSSVCSNGSKHNYITPIHTPTPQDINSYNYSYQQPLQQQQQLILAQQQFVLPLPQTLNQYYPLTPPSSAQEPFVYNTSYLYQKLTPTESVLQEQLPVLTHPQPTYIKEGPQFQLSSPPRSDSQLQYPVNTNTKGTSKDINHNDLEHMMMKKEPIKRRTRTGCLTCRKRRIKCDERKPFCGNCSKSKIYCHGYVNKPTKTELKFMAKIKKQNELPTQRATTVSLQY